MEDKFSNALDKLKKDGCKVWLHRSVRPYAPKIYQMMICYYEEREDYETCSFLFNVWESYQKSLTIEKIIANLS
jgi:hypothetical protein